MTMSAGTLALARQLAAELLPHLVDVAPEDLAVGTREVDVLEHAVVRLGAAANGRTDSRPFALVDDDDLAGLDLAHVGGVDQIERAGLGRDHHGVADRARAPAGGSPTGSRAAMMRSSVRKTSE